MSCLSGTTCSQMALSARCSGRNSDSGQRKITELILALKKKKNPEVDHNFKNGIKIKWILKCFGVFLASLTNKQFKNNNNLI